MGSDIDLAVHRYEAVTAETVRGAMTMTITMSEGAKPITSKTTVTAKWIAASCGDTK